MKKWLLLIVLLILPVFAHAASLTTGINVDGIGDLSLSRNVYNLKLHTSLDYATIAVATADGANVTITTGDGTVVNSDKVPVVEGANTIQIAVSNGTTTENWTINLTIDREMEIDSDNPSTGMFIPTILISVVILVAGLMFYYSKRKEMKKI
ncbi:MAG TPA: hypothetical protein DCE23_03075 [Firmicutes bacterium]|nr:hypothetical protein [Bacillota bacterium]